MLTILLYSPAVSPVLGEALPSVDCALSQCPGQPSWPAAGEIVDRAELLPGHLLTSVRTRSIFLVLSLQMFTSSLASHLHTGTVILTSVFVRLCQFRKQTLLRLITLQERISQLRAAPLLPSSPPISEIYKQISVTANITFQNDPLFT